jgi:putative phosphonate metabolism protein
MPQRFALYFAPPTSDSLWIRAAQWLGRDPAGGTPPAAAIPGIDALRRWTASESARRYGFHATIKAPMALADGETRAALEAELERFGPTRAQVEIGRLKVASIEGFIALIPQNQSQALTAFAADVVTHFDRFRAPLTAIERDKRSGSGRLSPRQVELLDRYGYPYVLEEFQFHMTLTDRLRDADRDQIMAAAREWFAPVLERAYMLDRIALFHESAPGAPFVRLADFPLAQEVAVDA